MQNHPTPIASIFLNLCHRRTEEVRARAEGNGALKEELGALRNSPPFHDLDDTGSSSIA